MQIKIGYVTNNASIDLVARELSQARVIGIDTETLGLSPHLHRVRLIQFATVDKVFVIDMFKVSYQLVREQILEKILPDKGKVKIFHNAKFDLEMIQTSFGYGLEEIECLFDTYVASKLCFGGSHYVSSLDNLCADYLGIQLDKTYQTYDYSGNIYSEQIQYAALDAAVLLPLYRLLSANVADNKLERVCKLEFDCIKPVAKLELNGCLIDKDLWIELANEGKENFRLFKNELEDYFGRINFNSNPQVCKIISGWVGYEVKSKSKDSLKDLIEQYVERPDMFGKVIDYRPALIKLLEYNDEKTYQERYGHDFLQHINTKTGRVHSQYKMTDTNTFRFSSSKPNLQNIKRDSKLRSAFIAPEGKLLACFDYSQIELRLLAHFSDDKLFKTAFANNEDLHVFMAAQMKGMTVEQLQAKPVLLAEFRQAAKTINFGIAYGLGATGLARKLGITIEAARKMLKYYYDSHPDLVAWFNYQEQYFKEYDCVRTVSGRLRDLSFWRNANLEFTAKQASKNFPIQSSSADILKTALVMLDKELPSDWLLVNQVHDEVIFEIPEGDAVEGERLLPEIMVKAGEKFVDTVAIKVDGKIGKGWSK